jgi:hypothetical protein
VDINGRNQGWEEVFTRVTAVVVSGASSAAVGGDTVRVRVRAARVWQALTEEAAYVVTHVA